MPGNRALVPPLTDQLRAVILCMIGGADQWSGLDVEESELLAADAPGFELFWRHVSAYR